MKIFFLLLFVVVIDAGCKSKNSEVLPPKKMQALLWDMMRADQFLADYVMNKDTSINRITESLKHYQPASSEPLTDSMIALPDTVNKVQIKSLPEAKPPSKKVRPVSY